MQVDNKEIQYNITLDATENIKILINENQAFNETVPVGYKCNITFMYQESKLIV